jgi:hypothetical protein
MTKLTIHLGIHRTGTTGLQRNLSDNRERLMSIGYAYPGDKNNHQEMAWGIHRGDVTGDDVLATLKPYNKYGHIILSGEDFCIHRSLDWIAPLKKNYEVDAIVYLRRQDHWLMSWYNQHVKWPFSRRHSTMTPTQFLECLEEFYWLDFDTLVNRWAAAVGKDKLHVRLIEKGQVRDSVIDCLNLVGLQPSFLTLNQASQNDSLPIETLEFARRSNMIDMRPGKRSNVIEFLKTVGHSQTYTGKTLYTAEQRRSVLARFEDANNKLARSWFNRDTLFQEGPPDDNDLYVEGTLAANARFEDLMMQTIAYLGQLPK